MAEGQRRRNIYPSAGASFVSSLAGGVTSALQKRQEQEMAMKLLFQKALAEAQAKEQFPSEEEKIQRRLRGLATEEAQPRFGAGAIGPPTAEQDFAQGQRGRETESLLNILKGRGSSSGVNVFSFDPATGAVNPATGGQALPPGSRVMPTRATAEEVEKRSAASKRGALGETGLSGESAGKLINLETAFTDMQEARDLVFPDGTPASQRTDLLRRLGTPLQVGSLMGGKKSDLTDAQKIISRIDNAIAAKLLVQTGVAARPDEIQALRSQFQPLARLTNEANFDRMNRLERFLRSGTEVIDPKRRFSEQRDGNIKVTPEGQTATNPQTGETLTYRNGQWQ